MSLVLPTLAEPFDALHFVRLGPDVGFWPRSGAIQFETLDTAMRVFETARDDCVPPELWTGARLDGLNFTLLVREIHPFTARFDERCRDMKMWSIMR